MGAWGSGSFDNDDASDWEVELATSGVAVIESTLRVVVPGEGYIQVDDCSRVIAAAEVVAALLGRPSSEKFGNRIERFLPDKPEIGNELVELATRAVARVLADNSELRSLWEGSDEFDQWKGNLHALQTRLAGCDHACTT